MEKTYATPGTAVIHEVLGDEVIIANLDSGIYYSIRECGVPIWQLLIAGFSLDEISTLATKQFHQEVLTDLEQFLKNLIQEQLLIPAKTSTPTLESLSLAWPSIYTPPALEKYEEMKNLLMLDPIHEVDEQGWPRRS